VQRKTPFIQPSAPTLRAAPPKGEGWLHELKFDGYRHQIHKDGETVTLYSRNGSDFTRRYPVIEAATRNLKAANAIIDGELVACDRDGHPDFRRLLHGTAQPHELVVWCFDLLALDGADLRALPFVKRRTMLAKLLRRAPSALMLSETFTDAERLLAECGKRGLEGIVSKRTDGPYRSGKGDWIKVKCAQWRLANRDRWELFEKPATRRPLSTRRAGT
jgi:bifunctional non-homologous end joining protein LigD